MAKLNWSPTLDFGIAKIDDQHKFLIELANRVIAAVSMKLGTREVDKIVKELREYTVMHFHDEEQFMIAARYPGLGAHQQEHVRLTTQVKHWQRDIFQKKELTPGEVLEFMRGWVLNHVLNSDMTFRDWLKEHPDALNGGKARSGGKAAEAEDEEE